MQNYSLISFLLISFISFPLLSLSLLNNLIQSIVMKKIPVIILAAVFVIAACNNANDKPPATDTIKSTTPIDTVKFDTVKPTDSIIKG
jgi:hypothetical protein